MKQRKKFSEKDNQWLKYDVNSQILWGLLSDDFWECIYCIFTLPCFGVGGKKLQGKYDSPQTLIVNKIKGKYSHIWGKVGIFKVCSSYFSFDIPEYFISMNQ